SVSLVILTSLCSPLPCALPFSSVDSSLLFRVLFPSLPWTLPFFSVCSSVLLFLFCRTLSFFAAVADFWCCSWLLFVVFSSFLTLFRQISSAGMLLLLLIFMKRRSFCFFMQ